MVRYERTARGRSTTTTGRRAPAPPFHVHQPPSRQNITGGGRVPRERHGCTRYFVRNDPPVLFCWNQFPQVFVVAGCLLVFPSFSEKAPVPLSAILHPSVSPPFLQLFAPNACGGEPVVSNDGARRVRVFNAFCFRRDSARFFFFNAFALVFCADYLSEKMS